MWIDSHCHLDSLKCESVGEALDRARVRGVDAFVCISTHLGNCARVVSYAEQYADVWATVGVHPLDLGDAEVELGVLRQWFAHPKVVAIGETGLDYHYSRETSSLQRLTFAEHVALAVESQLPVVVHTRNARADTLAILAEGVAQGLRGVLHCFTEDLEMAEQAVDWGLFVSFSGIVTFKNAEDLRHVVRQLPLHRLLVETDSPYLAPVPYRGRANEPKYVVEVGEFLATLLDLEAREFAKITADNTRSLFSRMGFVSN